MKGALKMEQRHERRTVTVANVQTGRGFDLIVILDRAAHMFKIYKKWYEYNSETDFGWHRKKVNEYTNLVDCMTYMTNVIAGWYSI